jgi:hypothetical protein
MCQPLAETVKKWSFDSEPLNQAWAGKTVLTRHSPVPTV